MVIKYPETKRVVRHIRELNNKYLDEATTQEVLAARNSIYEFKDAQEEVVSPSFSPNLHEIATNAEILAIKSMQLPQPVMNNIQKIFKTILDPDNPQIHLHEDVTKNEQAFNELSKTIQGFKENSDILERLGIKL